MEVKKRRRDTADGVAWPTGGASAVNATSSAISSRSRKSAARSMACRAWSTQPPSGQAAQFAVWMIRRGTPSSARLTKNSGGSAPTHGMRTAAYGPPPTARQTSAAAPSAAARRVSRQRSTTGRVPASAAEGQAAAQAPQARQAPESNSGAGVRVTASSGQASAQARHLPAWRWITFRQRPGSSSGEGSPSALIALASWLREGVIAIPQRILSRPWRSA